LFNLTPSQLAIFRRITALTEKGAFIDCEDLLDQGKNNSGPDDAGKAASQFVHSFDPLMRLNDLMYITR